MSCHACKHHSDRSSGSASFARYTPKTVAAYLSTWVQPRQSRYITGDQLCLDGTQQLPSLSIKLPAGLPASSQRSMYLGVYVGLGLGYSLLVFMRSWSNALGGFHAR